MLLNAPAANSVMLSTEANVCLLACPVITRRTITLVRRVTPLALHVEGLTRIIALRAPTPFPSLTELVFNTAPPASGATEIPDVNSVCSVRLAAKLVHWKKMVSALLAVSAKINGSSIPPRFSAWILHQIFALKVFVCMTSKYYEFNIIIFSRRIRCWWQVLPLPRLLQSVQRFFKLSVYSLRESHHAPRLLFRDLPSRLFCWRRLGRFETHPVLSAVPTSLRSVR